MALIAKQTRGLGFNGPLLGGDGWDSPDLQRLAGMSNNNGFFRGPDLLMDKRSAMLLRKQTLIA